MNRDESDEWLGMRVMNGMIGENGIYWWLEKIMNDWVKFDEWNLEQSYNWWMIYIGWSLWDVVSIGIGEEIQSEIGVKFCYEVSWWWLGFDFGYRLVEWMVMLFASYWLC